MVVVLLVVVFGSLDTPSPAMAGEIKVQVQGELVDASRLLFKGLGQLLQCWLDANRCLAIFSSFLMCELAVTREVDLDPNTVQGDTGVASSFITRDDSHATGIPPA